MPPAAIHLSEGMVRAFLALSLSCIALQAQSAFFDLQSYPDSPVTLEKCSPTIFRSEGKRRQFVTVKNASGKAAAVLLFQQTIPNESRSEIITLERVSLVLGPHETRRLSVNVEDVWNRLQSAARSRSAPHRPALSIVAVEFLDGSTWSAPVEGHR